VPALGLLDASSYTKPQIWEGLLGGARPNTSALGAGPGSSQGTSRGGARAPGSHLCGIGRHTASLDVGVAWGREANRAPWDRRDQKALGLAHALSEAHRVVPDQPGLCAIFGSAATWVRSRGLSHRTGGLSTSARTGTERTAPGQTWWLRASECEKSQPGESRTREQHSDPGVCAGLPQSPE